MLKRINWPRLRLDQIGSFKNGINKSAIHFGSGYPFVNLMDVFGKNAIGKQALSLVESTEQERKDFNLQAGDVLFVRSSVKPSGVGQATVVLANLEDTVFSGFLIRFRDMGQFDLVFKRYCFDEDSFRSALLKRSTVSAHTNINQGALSGMEISVPPLSEQRRIAEVLRTWDEAIEKAERLIAKKTIEFNHWSHALLTGRRRVGPNRSNWQSVPLTEVTLEATARNGGGQLDTSAVMGVHKLHGMIPMKDHVRAADLSRYKIVRQGAFAYNPMRLNIGSIAQNNHGRDVLVSPDYVAFEARPESLMPAYFDHIRRTPMWSRFVRSAGSGGVRIRIYYDDLTDFILERPPIDEQARLVEVLDTGRREIEIIERQRDALIRQKRGLMQKLLTGEWAIKVPDSYEAAE
jgi:type I restriction enzyme S subunit